MCSRQRACQHQRRLATLNINRSSHSGLWLDLPPMPSYDNTNAPAATPGTLSRRSGNAGGLPPRNYRVSHQKISIDVDLENNSIAGHTELTINATESKLQFLRLDCRQLEVSSVLVNQRRAQYYHQDPLKEEFKLMTNPDKSSRFSDVEQHHIYKSKMRNIFEGQNTSELTIVIPESLQLQKTESINSQNTPNGFRDSPGSHRATHTHPEVTYKALTISIEYTLKNPQTGLHYVGGKHSQLSRSDWHAYTTNSAIGVSTSSWVPCVDSLWEKPTWEVEISVPKTVKQIGVSKLISADVMMTGTEDDGEDEDPDDSHEIVVVGGDFSTQEESAHPVDLAKKLVTLQIPAPTSAHHIGWAVGPFVQTPLVNLEEENEPDTLQEKDTTAVPSAVFCLASHVNDSVNSTIFLYKAIDFYSREFGSYPYTSYGIVFVGDLDVDYNSFGGLSVISSRLLYPPTVIEPMFDTTYTLSVALAEQWSGTYLVPKTYNDIWTTIGISHFMTLQFIRKLMGSNEHKYRIKKQADMICDVDVEKPPLAHPFFRYPISMADLDFIKLKAPVVMFILDRRMTKTDKSFGLTRVIPKIFVQAMSGDLPNGCLSTHHFQHVCEKVGHNRLESFFRQWVYGSGVPIFIVTQRFNKKRMFIEMGIRQEQAKETAVPKTSGDTFVSEATRELNGERKRYSGVLFTGPMTIRIHEADGTPYEHIVDLKDGFTKLDIQYNTKYKRLKRSQKQMKSEKEAKDNGEEDDTVLLHCLGDILQTEKEVKEWNLIDWSREEEERMTNEAFEWIRVDADFEWICKIQINQPDYMYASQLQQDRDVEAQVQSIQYFANSNASGLYSSILLRTLMDSRYFYGVRIEAARAMSKLAKEQVGFIGSRHLLQAFRKNYCFENSTIPLPNDFTDFPRYFVKKAIIESLASVRDSNGDCPLNIRKFLLDLLRFNQNLNNPYEDSHYVAHLIDAITEAILANKLVNKVEHLSDVNQKFLAEAIDEITRQQKMDEWIPSNSGRVGVTAIGSKLRLARNRLLKISPEELLTRTKSSYADDIRVLSFAGLFNMGALKNHYILRYFFFTTFFERSLYLKMNLINAFVQCMGSAVIDGCGIELDEDELGKELEIEEAPLPNDTNLIVVEDSGNNREAFEKRKDESARSTLNGAIELLRRDFGVYEPLRELLWSAVRHPLLGLVQKRQLYDALFVLVPAFDSLTVNFEIPRSKRIRASNLGNGQVLLKRAGVVKITLPPKAKQEPVKPKFIIKPPSVPSSAPAPAPKLRKTYKAVIKRSDSGPLRYVKIDTRNKHITVSSDPLRLSKKVTIRMSKEKLKIATTPRSSPQPKVKVEVKQEVKRPKLMFKAPIMQPSSVMASSSSPAATAPPPTGATSSSEAPKPKIKLKFKKL